MNDASRHLVKKTPLKESHQEASCVTSPLKNITSITNIFDKMINSSHRQKKIVDLDESAKDGLENVSNTIKTSPVVIHSRKHNDSSNANDEQVCANSCTNKKKRKRRDSDTGINQINILDMLNKHRMNQSKIRLEKNTSSPLPLPGRTTSILENKSPLFKKLEQISVTESSSNSKESAKSNESSSTIADQLYDKNEHENPPSMNSNIIDNVFFNFIRKQIFSYPK